MVLLLAVLPSQTLFGDAAMTRAKLGPACLSFRPGGCVVFHADTFVRDWRSLNHIPDSITIPECNIMVPEGAKYGGELRRKL